MDMPSAFPPGTDFNFPSLSVCVSACVSACFSSGCFCAASLFGGGASRRTSTCCSWSCEALFCCARTAVGATAKTASNIQRTLLHLAWEIIVSLLSPFGFLDCEGRQSIWRLRCRPEQSGCTPRNAPARTCNRRDTGRTELQGSCAQSESLRTVPESPHNNPAL